MNINDIDHGQLSQEAVIVITILSILASVVESIPTLQAISYIVAIFIGLGTILINRNKYFTEFKKILKSIKDGFKKTK
jgi:hypothetical protein